jgi:chromosome segregation ATPase
MTAVADDLRSRLLAALDQENQGGGITREMAVDVMLEIRDEELERLREERDQAIAHDRQPYPTRWAYDQACAALQKHRERAEQSEAEAARLRAQVADYENAISWDVSCTGHAKLLDECRSQEERAEKAEREAEQRRLAYNAANAMAGVHKHRAERLKAELEHAKGALAGDSEATAGFMADHAEVLARAREQRDMWQRATEQAEGRLEAVRKYIDEDFRFWRSPAGAAGQYARALIDFIDREDPDRA